MDTESNRFVFVLGLLAFSASGAHAATPEQASDMLLRQDWQGARAAYEELLAEDPDNAAYHYSLGRAQHGLSNCGDAVTEYRKAMSLGYEDEATARVQIARCQASLGEREAALTELERVAANRSGRYASGPTNRIIAAQPEFDTYGDDARFRAVLEKMTPCNTPAHRQFDFWVGTWEIRAGSPDGGVAGVNEIRLINDGCTLHENYRSRNDAYVGQSLSFYDGALDKWHQTWIDYLGFPLYMDGGLNERGEMVMTDDTSTPGTIHRVTWSPLPGSLRQHWQTSTDGGKTWSTVFDGYYSKLDKP